MAATYSRMNELGTPAPDFELPAVNPSADARSGATRHLDDFAGARALVVAFLCNHCPYVRHVEDALLQAARDYAPRGVQFVGICSNDADRYPDDSFDALAARAREKAYPFPYLHDEAQTVARDYGAVCTPDVFVFDEARRLAYRGRLDDTRPGQGTATARDLRQALDQLLAEGAVHMDQFPSMGCNIKWKPGNAPQGA
jgi:peroxiredoxin